jgi:prolyl-tRNA synthetase
MLDYYNVSGCYVLKPWSYSIWELIQGKVLSMSTLDNGDLPSPTMKNGSTRRLRRWASKMHISRCLYRNECSSGRRIILRVFLLRSLGLHERAFVRIGPNLMPRLTLPSRGQSDLEEPIAIRPTSETAMYPCELVFCPSSFPTYDDRKTMQNGSRATEIFL